MLRTSIAAVAFTLFAGPAHAAPIADSDAANHVGQTVTLDCNVASIHASGSGTTFVNCGAPYPDQKASLVVFPGTDVGNLQKYHGRHLLVHGTIKLYKEKPEIVLESASQIEGSH